MTHCAIDAYSIAVQSASKTVSKRLSHCRFESNNQSIIYYLNYNANSYKN